MKCPECNVDAVRWVDDGDTLTTCNAAYEVIREAKCYAPMWLCGNCGYVEEKEG